MWACNVDPNAIREGLIESNSNRYEKFLEKIELRIKDYFDKEERTKYNHLEQYETHDFGLFGLGVLSRTDTKKLAIPTETKKVKKVNYNFYCIDDNPGLIDLAFFDDYLELITKLTAEFEKVANRYIERFDRDEIVASEENFYDKAIVYVEGHHDIDLIVKAAEHLNKKHILQNIELRQRGGFRNLDKIWKFYKEHSVEVTGQIKILLYDCDTNKHNEDFGYIFKRTIPTFEGHIISKGIENLFNNITTQNALNHKNEFIDFCTKKGTKRGVKYYEEINEVKSEEKANFSKWICENGIKEDFINFKVVFEIIEEMITKANNNT